MVPLISHCSMASSTKRRARRGRARACALDERRAGNGQGANEPGLDRQRAKRDRPGDRAPAGSGPTCARLRDQRPLAVILDNLGYTTLVQGDPSGACLLFEESAALHHKIDNLFGQANALVNLAAAQFGLGELNAAKHTFEEVLQMATRLRSAEFVAYALQGIAATIAESRPEQAAQLLGASGRLLYETETKLEAVEASIREAALARVAARLGQRMQDSIAAGAKLEMNDAVKRALTLD